VNIGATFGNLRNEVLAMTSPPHRPWLVPGLADADLH
jgi:hypothetical protein